MALQPAVPVRRWSAPPALTASFGLHALAAGAAVIAPETWPWALGAIALLLTITGIYGVLSFVVALREKEIGIRCALGATSRAIIGLVVRQSIRLAAIGVVVGALLALGASRFISSHLTMIPAFDAVAFGSGMVIVLSAALAAAFGPARRAASVEVVESLKS